MSEIKLGVVCPMANERETAVRFVREVLGQCAPWGFKSVTFFAVLDRVSKDGTLDLLRELEAERTDFRAIGRVIAPWGRRIGDLRFETEGAWKRGGTTVDSLARELKLALEYPEGAGV